MPEPARLLSSIDHPAGLTCRVHALLVTWLAAAIALVAPIAVASKFERPTEETKSLRAHGKFAEAVGWCQEQLAQESLPPKHRAILTAELIDLFAAQGLTKEKTAADQHWQQARSLAKQYMREYGNHPWAAVVALQAAASARLQAERALDEARAANQADLVAAGREQMRQAMSELRRLDERLAAIRRSAPEAAASETGPSERELAVLMDRERLELARALRAQAATYPPGSADRIDLLLQARERLEPLARGVVGREVNWPARVEEVTCLRLAGELKAAAARLRAYDEERPAEEWGGLLMAEKLRLFIAAGKVSEAATAVDQLPVSWQVPELSLAAIEAVLAAYAQSSNSGRNEQAAQYLQQAGQLAQDLARREGAFQGQKAQALVAAALGATPAATRSSTPDAQEQQAAALYRSGRLDEALAAYDQAATSAAQLGDREAAWQLGYAAAAIEHRRAQHQAAATRFHALSQNYPEHPQASGAHLLAIHHAGILRRQTAKENEAFRSQYAGWLDEHLERWPSADTAADVRLRRAALAESEGDLERAIIDYRQIPAGHARLADAIAGLGRCYERQVVVLREQERSAAHVAEEAQRQIARMGARMGASMAPADPEVRVEAAKAVAVARVWLAARSFENAERILQQSGTAAGASEHSLDSAAQALLVVALAGQERLADAEQAASAVAPKPRVLFELVERLTALERQDQQSDPRNAELRLAVLDRIAPLEVELTDAQRRDVARLRALALADAGRRKEAIKHFELLRAAQPDEIEAQQRLAELLSQATEPATLEKALTRWREIERRSRPGSMRWLHAKYGLASVHERLGQHDLARKIVLLTEALHPELGSPELKASFQALAARCERQASDEGNR